MGFIERRRDAEAELNLPPGFRFHPTDEELVVHYLCRKAACQRLPAPIIAEVDLYKCDPWDLPEKALFGQREWYFFTPRDRKYPNGLRPNRSAGRGYWKATGADKPVVVPETVRPAAIKKALVFYQGKPPRGVKTDWIMHEYRLTNPNRSTPNKKDTLRLDDWVLCRLYNKKNNWEKKKTPVKTETVESPDTISDSLRTPESDIDHEGNPADLDELIQRGGFYRELYPNQTMNDDKHKEESDWITDFNLDDLQSPFAGIESIDVSSQDYYFPWVLSPDFKSSMPSF